MSAGALSRSRAARCGILLGGLLAAFCCAAVLAQTVRYFPLPAGAGPHDVAPAPDGMVWYTAQRAGALGRLDPASGRVEQIPLGPGSAPHGVIVGPDGAAWVTDGGQNAIVRVDPASRAVKVFPLPAGTPNANLNTAVFDHGGLLWYTGQAGYYGSVNPATAEVRVWNAPQGRGPYGITVTPAGELWYASLAGNHIARIDTRTGTAAVVQPPTPAQGARRVWSDSRGHIWVSEWLSGQVSVYDPGAKTWRQWHAPAGNAHAYAVFVDDRDVVWLTEWTANAILRFDPANGEFRSFPSDRRNASVRQLLGRPGEVWGAESANDRLVRIKTN